MTEPTERAADERRDAIVLIEEAGGWRVILSGLPGCSAWGSTKQLAYAELCDAAVASIRAIDAARASMAGEKEAG